MAKELIGDMKICFSTDFCSSKYEFDIFYINFVFCIDFFGRLIYFRGMKNAVVMLKKISLENFKNVKKGEIPLVRKGGGVRASRAFTGKTDPARHLLLKL